MSIKPINRDDVFRTVIAIILSLLAYIGNGIRNEQNDMACRLRNVEINQARIMERMNIDPVLSEQVILRQLSKNLPD